MSKCAKCFYVRFKDGKLDCTIGYCLNVGIKIQCRGFQAISQCLMCHRPIPASRKFCSKYCLKEYHNERKKGNIPFEWRFYEGSPANLRYKELKDGHYPNFRIFDIMKQEGF